MKLIFLFSLLCTVITVYAQDEYPDMRSKKDNFKKVSQKDVRSDAATFTMSGIDESISTKPLVSIPVTDYSKEHIQFAGNGIEVSISAGDFEAAKHKLTYSEKYLIKIDNKPYYGKYTEVPKHSIANVSVVIDKDTVAIPPCSLCRFV